MVPTVYQRFINVVNTLTSDLRGSSTDWESEMAEAWKPFIAEALALPAQHRY